MPSDSPTVRPPLFDLGQAPALACPVCYGDLGIDAGRVVCAACSRSYPIVDGIPILIPDRAEQR
jgi:uncharacterized protein YbaR (Trm112 family)